MGRRLRVYYNNAVYHITIRGNNKQAILKTEDDKMAFLETLNKYKNYFKFKLFGFVLMDNHVHLVLEVKETKNISTVMQAIALSYSQKFRHKYNYTGYVWQGRFRSNIIEKDEYIIDCLNYIHNNPVRANIVQNISDYIWSSYHFYNSDMNLLKEFITIDKPML